MTTTESIDIPSERVPPVATDMASSSKTVAGVLLFLTFILAIAAIGAVSDGNKRNNGYDPSNTAETAGHAVGTVIGIGLFVAIPGWLGFRSARNASRATRAATHATQLRWRLSGKHLIAVDPAGIPRPDLSFKLNTKLRTMLLAIPRAEVRS
jgi:hypothetical protein